MAHRGDFTENLGRIYGIYVGGFVIFVIAMALLELLHVPSRFILWAYMALTVSVYALIGIMSRTSDVDQYYVAGQQVPAIYNGMASGADWISGASFVGMAGTLYVLGYDALAFVLGWTGGYVLVAVLLAPYLRKIGAFTLPDFLGMRYGGNLPRLVGIVVLFCCSFTYLTAQVYAVGIITSRFLDIDFQIGVFAGLAGILLCTVLGGMRSLSWTQVAQYIVMIAAYLVPAIWMSTVATGIPVPQITYGSALDDIARMEQTLGVTTPFAQPFTNLSPRDFFFLVCCLMVGTASLPHVLMRFFTTPTVREARKSVGWSLFFIFLLYVTVPAYATFARFNVMSLFTADGGTLLAFDHIPAWVFRWGAIEGKALAEICGVKATALEVVRAACEAKGLTHGFGFTDLRLDADMIVLSTPEIAGFGVTMVYLIGNIYGPDLIRASGDETSWFAVQSISAGIFGIPVSFVVAWVVSRLTVGPAGEIQDMVVRLRVPRGGQMIDQDQ